MSLRKLSLQRETITVLGDDASTAVQGGMPPRAGFSEMRGCSQGGGVCTSGCPITPGSGTCTPTGA